MKASDITGPVVLYQTIWSFFDFQTGKFRNTGIGVTFLFDAANNPEGQGEITYFQARDLLLRRLLVSKMLDQHITVIIDCLYYVDNF